MEDADWQVVGKKRHLRKDNVQSGSEKGIQRETSNKTLSNYYSKNGDRASGSSSRGLSGRRSDADRGSKPSDKPKDLEGLSAAVQWARPGTGEIAKLLETCSFKPGPPAYTTLIKACGRAGHWEKGLELYEYMKSHGVVANSITFSALINACGKCRQWEKALELFTQMRENDVEANIFTYSALISACAKGKQWDRATKVFDEMQEAGVAPDGITYSAMISACERGRQWGRALDLFREMESAGYEANVITFNSLLRACDRAAQAQRAFELYEKMKHAQVAPDRNTYAALLSLCEKVKDSDRALALLASAKETEVPFDAALYNSAIGATSKKWAKALEVLQEMRNDGLEPSVLAFTALISGLEKAGEWEQALGMFESMIAAGKSPNALTYSVALSACEKGQQRTKAIELFDAMLKAGVPADAASYGIVVSACEATHNWQKALQVLEVCHTAGIVLGAHMYSSVFANIEGAEVVELFDGMLQAGAVPDGPSSEIVLTECQKMGHADRALQLLEQLEASGERPLAKMYGPVISLCARKGKEEDALAVFERVKTIVVFDTKLYNTVLSLLLRTPAQREKCLNLYEVLKSVGVKCDKSMAASFMEACEKGQDWSTAKLYYEELSQSGLEMNNAVYHKALSELGQSSAAALKEVEESSQKLSKQLNISAKEFVPGQWVGA